MVIFEFRRRALAWLTGVVLAFGAAQLLAQEEAPANPGPGEVVRTSTDIIMALVQEAPDYVDEDPQRYFDAIGTELDKVVDFRGFARGIMGDFASSTRYRSLDAEGKETLRDQLNRFTEVVRSGLIETYGRGLIAFGGSRVEIAGTEFSPGSTRVASVTQLVFDDQGRVYTVRYQMGQYRDGSWQLRNMIIENINLGEIYRSQFKAALDDAEGDVEVVIAGWNTKLIDPDQPPETS